MKQIYIFSFLMALCFYSYGDRIYIVNSPGFNAAEPQLVSAIIANGHTVTVAAAPPTGLPVLPSGFTSTCIDPVNGYDWLCFFGPDNFSGMLPQIKTFIDKGGKVFYQYEVSCCTGSSVSAKNIINGLTGLSVNLNVNSHIAFIPTHPFPGWCSSQLSCCTKFYGNAYCGFDNLPAANQFVADSTLNMSTPPVSDCSNFGFHFGPDEFISAAHKGGIVGIGDYNIWFDGDKPLSWGGHTPVNPAVVAFFFPNATDTCYLFPPGCLTSLSPPPGPPHVNLGNDTILCDGQSITLNIQNAANANYVWQDHSSLPTYTITQAGTYWAKVSNICGEASDTLVVDIKYCETVLQMPNIFSPNNDGINDYFFPVIERNVLNPVFMIYNRWGQKVYESNDLSKGWDGSVNNNPCSDGVYYWILSYSDIDLKEGSKSGFLSLVR